MFPWTLFRVLRVYVQRYRGARQDGTYAFAVFEIRFLPDVITYLVRHVKRPNELETGPPPPFFFAPHKSSIPSAWTTTILFCLTSCGADTVKPAPSAIGNLGLITRVLLLPCSLSQASLAVRVRGDVDVVTEGGRVSEQVVFFPTARAESYAPIANAPCLP